MFVSVYINNDILFLLFFCVHRGVECAGILLHDGRSNIALIVWRVILFDRAAMPPSLILAADRSSPLRPVGVEDRVTQRRSPAPRPAHRGKY